LALFLNAGILILAAAVFSTRGIALSDLREAHALLTPLLGSAIAAVLFAVGLLCAGQSATITGTLAGQIIMEGFVRLRVSPVVRRAITRGLAVIPAVAVLAIVGEDGTMPLLVASQVILSLQLPFAIVPLIRFTNSQQIMGDSANSALVRWLAMACALLVSIANAALVLRTLAGWSEKSSLATLLFGSIACAALGLLVWLCLVPLRRRVGLPRPMRAGYGTLAG
jgi:manganese transport protein